MNDETTSPEFFSQDDSPHGDLSSVKRGLRLVYWGLAIFLFGVIVLVISVRVPALKIVVTGTWCVSVAFAVFGKLMCLKTPQHTGGRGFIVASVTLDALAIFGNLWQLYVLYVPGAADGVSHTALKNMLFGATLMQLAAFVLFLLYIQAIANFLRRMDLANTAVAVLALGLAVIPVSYSSVLAFSSSLTAGFAMTLFVAIMGIAFIIKYGNLIGKISDVI